MQENTNRSDNMNVKDGRQFTLEAYVQSSPLLYTKEGLPAHLGDMYQGNAAFLVAGGPSLAKIDTSRLSHPGCLTMGINNAVKAVRTDLWTSIGPPSHFMKSIWLDPKITKFSSFGYAHMTIFDNEHWRETNIKLKECPNIFFFQPNGEFHAESFLFEETINCGNTADKGGGRSSFLVALKLLFILGIRRVFLLGVDFKMNASSQYHFKHDVPQDGIDGNNRLYRILGERLEILKPHFEETDFLVFNCNPDSALTVFPHVPFEDALDSVTAEMPKSIKDERTDGLYTRTSVNNDRRRKAFEKIPLVIRPKDVEHVRASSQGIVTCCDSGAEWLLEWWYGNLMAHNDVEVEIVDTGMSQEAKIWCANNNITVTSLPQGIPAFSTGWYYKPFAITACQSEKSLFLDLDCEVRGSLQPVFDYIGENIVLAHDPYPVPGYEELYLRHLYFNSGVVGVHKEHCYLILVNWCEKIIHEHERYRGDQEILNLVLYDMESTVVSLPREYNWLRAEGANDDATVMHWTGSKGKDIIRSKMEAARIGPIQMTT